MLAVAGVTLVMAVITVIALDPWSGPGGEEADLAASLAGAVRGASGCTQQDGRDWWWCGTSYDWFDGFEGPYYRLRANVDKCWLAAPAHVRRVHTPPGATYPRAVKVVEGDGRVLRGCVGSGRTGKAVDGPGQIPRLVGG